MSLPINNGNLGSSSTPAGSTAITVAYPPPNNYYSQNPAAIGNLSTIPPFGIPFPRATAFPVPTRITTVYEFDVQPPPTHNYNFVNSGTANSVSFHGWLNDGDRTYYLSQQNLSGSGSLGLRALVVPFFGATTPSSGYEAPSTWAPTGTLGPRAPVVPFFNAMAPSSSYEGPSTLQAPRSMASSSSSRGRRRIEEEPMVRQITQSEHRCHECGKTFPTGPALGGHASHHSKRRRQELARSLRSQKTT